MTHPAIEVDLVQALHREGLNQSEIARLTGIKRTTLGQWIRARRSGAEVLPCRSVVLDAHHIGSCELRAGLPHEQYAYLLGLYLGDGCISLMKKGVYALRIACCEEYPN